MVHVGLLVLISHLYIEIETSLAHFQNVDNVVRSGVCGFVRRFVSCWRGCSAALLILLLSARNTGVVAMTLLLRMSAEVESEISDSPE